jgi:uncharacterized repeat protein (TIGR03803 family)
LKTKILFFALVALVAAMPRLPAQTVQTLCSFNGTNGAYPQAALTLGNDGNFYGTTTFGDSGGTVFKVTTNGTLTTLVSFKGTNGVNPCAALTLGTDGNFYGTTEGGSGKYYYGTVFKVTTNGALSTLYGFTGFNDGGNPYAALTLGNDGNFYGTTSIGGSGGDGTVFKVTTNGTLTTLVPFNGGNGAYPYDALTLSPDGNFYGTTCGAPYDGTVFKMTTNGALTTLVFFNGTDGENPTAALTLGSDGSFYGTTEEGGAYMGPNGDNSGTVFKMTTNGVLTTLVSFNGTNGGMPYAALTLGNDGNFYGTTQYGGSNYWGTIFQVKTNGTLTTLFSFSRSSGGYPPAGLTLGTDGNFYGTTYTGGSGGCGTVFRLSLPPPPSLTLQFSSGCPLLNLYGTLGETYTVQYSTNLADANWFNLLSVTNLSCCPYEFLDSAGVVPPARFYRAFMQ